MSKSIYLSDSAIKRIDDIRSHYLSVHNLSPSDTEIIAASIESQAKIVLGGFTLVSREKMDYYNELELSSKTVINIEGKPT